MKIFIEHEVSDDPILCDDCRSSHNDYCYLFRIPLSLSHGSFGETIKCKECLSASKIEPCKCSSKKYSLTVIESGEWECTRK